MSEETTLRIERIIDARPAEVFHAWTTPSAMEQWYRDGDDFVARVVELELRPGGKYRIEFGPVGQVPYVEYGEYLEIDPPHRLVWTETLEGVDAPWSGTRVTLELRDDNGKTRLNLTHEGFATRSHRDVAAGGWPGFLDRIDRLLS
jgi:uncharacterized protein YndB with AHSA1/START domain